MNSTRKSSLKKQIREELYGTKTEDCLLQNGQEKQVTKNTAANRGPVSPPRTPGPTGLMAVHMSPPTVSPILDRWIRQRARDLTLRKVDVQRSSKVVNNFRDRLLEFLKNNQEKPYFRQAKVLNSGSYFELVKINSPNEFDMMLILPTPRLNFAEVEDFPGLYKVSVTRPVRSNEIRSYLLDDQRTISAARIRTDTRDLVCKFLRTCEGQSEDSSWKVCVEDENSPAVTLELWTEGRAEADLSIDVVPALEGLSQGLPIAARAGPNVENWLGKNARRKLISSGCYFVPKMPKGSNHSDTAKESFRISFSHTEKEIIRNHGNKRTCCEVSSTRCCRKTCLRLLKRLIEGLKERYPEQLEPLCSYHGKTAFFHALCRHGDDSKWTVGDMSKCFMFLLDIFEGFVQSGHLPHFFVPSCNLFAPPAFPQSTLEFLGAALREQRDSNLCALQPRPPVPAVSSPLEVETVGAATAPESCQMGFSRASVRRRFLAVMIGLLVVLLAVILAF